jgi:hypothetical protein
MKVPEVIRLQEQDSWQLTTTRQYRRPAKQGHRGEQTKHPMFHPVRLGTSSSTHDFEVSNGYLDSHL